MKSIESCGNTNPRRDHAATRGREVAVRLPRTSVRAARSLLGDELPEYFSGQKARDGILAVAVFNRSADLARLTVTHVLIWAVRKFGESAVQEAAVNYLGLHRGDEASIATLVADRKARRAGGVR